MQDTESAKEVSILLVCPVDLRHVLLGMYDVLRIFVINALQRKGFRIAL